MSQLVTDNVPHPPVERRKAYSPTKNLSILERRVKIERRYYARCKAQVQAETIVTKLHLRLSLAALVLSWVYFVLEVNQ